MYCLCQFPKLYDILILVLLFGTGIGLSIAGEEPTIYQSHAIAMHGQPKYEADFNSFEYVYANAPKGGRIIQGAFGTYDNLNPYILKGQPPRGINYLFESLMTNSYDEAFTEYGLLAESIEWPSDRSWVAFTLRQEARWHDGKPVTCLLYTSPSPRDS